MNISKVLFVGGGGGNMSAVQVRCIDIATRLGCDFVQGIQFVEQIPDRYEAFVCVKPSLRPEELIKLAQRGKVIWDIIDAFPPREGVALYLASSPLAQHLFEDYGRVDLVPHHHCNFEELPSAADNRRPAWIGSRHWLPALPGLEFDTYFVEGKTREAVAAAFRRSGIGLNFRGKTALQASMVQRFVTKGSRQARRLAQNQFDLHIAINSGIKLINCIGFGLPSVSSDEPAYQGFGPDCTIFSTPGQCARRVNELQADEALYAGLREHCLKKAKVFHIDTIIQKYGQVFESL